MYGSAGEAGPRFEGGTKGVGDGAVHDRLCLCQDCIALRVEHRVRPQWVRFP